MSYYTPQPITCHPAMEMQHFRKGQCAPFQNVVLVNGNSHKFTNIMLKRDTLGDPCTVTIVDLNDVDKAELTIPTQEDYTLDNGVDAYEMHVLRAGSWTTLLSLVSGFYYLRIEDGVNTWYTDELYFDQAGSAQFPLCGEGFVKLTWDQGRCIKSGVSTDGTTPVLAYPDEDIPFFCFLKADLSQPEWEYEEKGDDDAAGMFVFDSKHLVKRWRLEGEPISEGLVDALQASSLFDEISIEYPTMTGSVFQNISHVVVEPNTENGGCLYSYKYNFTTDYLLKQNCC